MSWDDEHYIDEDERTEPDYDRDIDFGDDEWIWGYDGDC